MTSSIRAAVRPLSALETETNDVLSAVTETEPSSTTLSTRIRQQQRRVLGSQELLMLPRQYAPNKDVTFPQMNHVSCTVLSATPDEDTLCQAIDEAITSHPLLQAHVQGDGEPDERIDLFQMVRKGEPNPCTFVVNEENMFTSKDVLTVVNVDENDGRQALDTSWKGAFHRDLDDGSWCNVETGPLWKVEFHRTSFKKSNDSCALVFSFNHAISDQSSANMLADQIIANMASIEESNKIVKEAVKHDMPLALEDSVLGNGKRFSDVQVGEFSPGTVKYVADKAAEGFKNPVILPDSDRQEDGGGILGALTIISGKASGGQDEKSLERKSTLQFRKLSKDATSALLSKCREREVSMTNALSAAVTLTATDFIDNGTEKGESRNYKVLQSLDMRRFGEQLDKCETVACMAGSMDLLHGPLPDKSGQALRDNTSAENLYQFWKLALEGKEQTAAFIESDGPRHAVRVFDFAMSISDMNNLIHLTAQSKDTQGRAYSAGISNVGVYDRQKAVRRRDDIERDLLQVSLSVVQKVALKRNMYSSSFNAFLVQISHGRYTVEEVFFATSHARTGCLYQVSCLTVDGEMQCTFHPASPVVSEETNAKFADAFMDMLETVAGLKGEPAAEESGFTNPLSLLPENTLAGVTALVGGIAVASHAGAWQQFFQSLTQMRENVQDPEQFWAALNFWIFFAVGHPILQPILWISDVLHGSPGPMVANLVPITFIAGNILAIAAFTSSKEVSSFATYSRQPFDPSFTEYRFACHCDRFKRPLILQHSLPSLLTLEPVLMAKQGWETTILRLTIATRVRLSKVVLRTTRSANHQWTIST